jgi:hypothetical protein
VGCVAPGEEEDVLRDPVRYNYLRISGPPSLGALILITLTTSGGTTTMLPIFYKNLKSVFKTFNKKVL